MISQLMLIVVQKTLKYIKSTKNTILIKLLFKIFTLFTNSISSISSFFLHINYIVLLACSDSILMWTAIFQREPPGRSG